MIKGCIGDFRGWAVSGPAKVVMTWMRRNGAFTFNLTHMRLGTFILGCSPTHYTSIYLSIYLEDLDSVRVIFFFFFWLLSPPILACFSWSTNLFFSEDEQQRYHKTYIFSLFLFVSPVLSYIWFRRLGPHTTVSTQHAYLLTSAPTTDHHQGKRGL